jgi:hypothetical protein
MPGKSVELAFDRGACEGKHRIERGFQSSGAAQESEQVT